MKTLLADPAIASFELGSIKSFKAQRELILGRKLTKATYDDWYARMMADIASVREPGALLEIGSGANYAKLVSPEIITSDVVPGASDLVVDAQNLPFDTGSLRAILLTHVFHHIPDPAAFLAEATRALVDGGVISIIDVAHTPFARLLFGRFHPEAYESKTADWALDTSQVYGGANQAMSWIVFQRDAARFRQRFPTLSIEVVEYLPWLGYMLSGGVTKRNLVPDAIVPAIRLADRASRVFDSLMSLHWHIRIRHTPRT